jgi:hypothetical protein
MTEKPLSIVILHHQNEADISLRLKKHLTTLTSKEEISVWDGDDITGGGHIEQEPQLAVEGANIVVCLISADLLADEGYWNNFVGLAYQKSQNGSLKLLPVLARACDWEGTFLGKMKVLPKSGKSIRHSKWADADEPYREIAKEIEALVKQINLSQKPKTTAQQGSVIPNEFQEIEAIFETKKDDEVMSHIAYVHHKDKSTGAAHFAVYGEMLREIRERMEQERFSDFYFGNIEDAALIDQIGRAIKERSDLLKIDMLGLGKLCRDLIQASRDFRVDFALPEHKEVRNRDRAYLHIVKPFCAEILKFEKKLNNLSAHRKIDVDLSSINLN